MVIAHIFLESSRTLERFSKLKSGSQLPIEESKSQGIYESTTEPLNDFPLSDLMPLAMPKLSEVDPLPPAKSSSKSTLVALVSSVVDFCSLAHPLPNFFHINSLVEPLPRTLVDFFSYYLILLLLLDQLLYFHPADEVDKVVAVVVRVSPTL